MLFNLYLLTTGASIAMNVSRSLNAKARLENVNDEVIKKYNNLSTRDKVLSNLGNFFKTLCPVYNIIHSIKNVKTDKEELCQKWKKKTLDTTIYIKASDEVKQKTTQDNQTHTEKTATQTRQPKKVENTTTQNRQPKKVENTTQNKTQEQNNTPAKTNKTAKYLHEVWVEEYNKYNALAASGTATREELNLQARKVQIACDKYYQVLGVRNNTPEVNNASMSRKLV